ncbi:MAG: hypothetical protein WD844_14320 [Thermoleophilaceae bacterium]
MRAGAWISRCVERILGEDSGFTLIELISAMLVTVIGVVALITTLDSSRQLIGFSESKESAVHVAQQELERIQALDYDDIALDDHPEACSSPCDENNPAFYVKGDWYRWNQRPWGEECDASGVPHLDCEGLVVEEGAGGVVAAREEITENGPTGGVRLTIEIQRFITSVDDDCVKEPPNVGGCTGTEDYRRITVAVRVVGVIAGEREGLLNGGPGRPILLSTVVRPA